MVAGARRRLEHVDRADPRRADPRLLADQPDRFLLGLERPQHRHRRGRAAGHGHRDDLRDHHRGHRPVDRLRARVRGRGVGQGDGHAATAPARSSSGWSSRSPPAWPGALINGFLIAKAKIPPFIVTLGTFGVALGAALLITGGVDEREVPTKLITGLGTGRLAGIPWLVVIAAVVCLIFGVILAQTRFGRYTYAAGSNAGGPAARRRERRPPPHQGLRADGHARGAGRVHEPGPLRDDDHQRPHDGQPATSSPPS